jgi:hypothetical protein
MSPLIRRAYWQATALALAAHFAGWPPGLPLAMAATLAQAVHFLVLRRPWRALEVQVRWFYLGLLCLGAWPGMAWVHALQFAGLVALLVTDYCPAARTLMLLPWNRPGVPLSLALLRWLLLSPPAPGSIAERLAQQHFGARLPGRYST